MYKEKSFRIREIKEIIKDLQTARNIYPQIKRIFLADENALVLKTEDLIMILFQMKVLFPECERVGIYAAPKDILRKSIDELITLEKCGLGIVYMGLESGSDSILRAI